MAEPLSRRVFGVVFASASAALGALYAIPGIRYLVGARKQDDEAVIDAGALASLPDGKPQRAAITLHDGDAWSQSGARVALYLLRDGNSVRAIDAACPHTGCAVDWNAERHEFRCPCHRSCFSIEGARISGPALRGLDPQTVEIREGRVLVRYRRYRAGRADRVPV